MLVQWMVNIDSELCICELNVKWDFQPSLQGHILGQDVKDFYICPVLWYWLKTTTVVI